MSGVAGEKKRREAGDGVGSVCVCGGGGRGARDVPVKQFFVFSYLECLTEMHLTLLLYPLPPLPRPSGQSSPPFRVACLPSPYHAAGNGVEW